jgi:AcrR family transcriptional regulator
MPRKAKEKKLPSTEEKIREAARKLFTSQGYAATRTRDIAEEAGINLALLNYYFRSKEKLFELVMQEKMEKFFSVLALLLQDRSTTLAKKIEAVAANYIDLVIENPELPLFVLSELRQGQTGFIRLAREADFINDSEFMRQLKQERPDVAPLQFLVSLLGMCLFPFLMKPVVLRLTNMKEESFRNMMLERKKLIPVWTRAMLKAK